MQAFVKKSLASFLTFAMMIGLLPMMSLSAGAVSTTLINVKADYNFGDAPGCSVSPARGATDNSGNTYVIGNWGKLANHI